MPWNEDGQYEVEMDSVEDWNPHDDFPDQEDFDDVVDHEEYIPGEEMDGDHESGLASAGWGTDEDYGGCGDYGDYGDY